MDPSPSGFQPPQKPVPKWAQVGWRAMMIFNLSLGAYMFARKRENDIDAGEIKGVKKRNKGVKKGVVNTEDEKKDAENNNVADIEKIMEAESAITVSVSDIDK